MEWLRVRVCQAERQVLRRRGMDGLRRRIWRVWGFARCRVWRFDPAFGWVRGWWLGRVRQEGFAEGWFGQSLRWRGGECPGLLVLWSGLAPVVGRFPKGVCYSLQTQAVPCGAWRGIFLHLFYWMEVF
jgi:hypothetical protein